MGLHDGIRARPEQTPPIDLKLSELSRFESELRRIDGLPSDTLRSLVSMQGGKLLRSPSDLDQLPGIGRASTARLATWFSGFEQGQRLEPLLHRDRFIVIPSDPREQAPLSANHPSAELIDRLAALIAKVESSRPIRLWIEIDVPHYAPGSLEAAEELGRLIKAGGAQSLARHDWTEVALGRFTNPEIDRYLEHDCYMRLRQLARKALGEMKDNKYAQHPLLGPLAVELAARGTKRNLEVSWSEVGAKGWRKMWKSLALFELAEFYFNQQSGSQALETLSEALSARAELLESRPKQFYTQLLTKVNDDQRKRAPEALNLIVLQRCSFRALVPSLVQSNAPYFAEYFEADQLGGRPSIFEVVLEQKLEGGEPSEQSLMAILFESELAALVVGGEVDTIRASRVRERLRALQSADLALVTSWFHQRMEAGDPEFTKEHPIMRLF